MTESLVARVSHVPNIKSGVKIFLVLLHIHNYAATLNAAQV